MLPMSAFVEFRAICSSFWAKYNCNGEATNALWGLKGGSILLATGQLQPRDAVKASGVATSPPFPLVYSLLLDFNFCLLEKIALQWCMMLTGHCLHDVEKFCCLWHIVLAPAPLTICTQVSPLLTHLRVTRRDILLSVAALIAASAIVYLCTQASANTLPHPRAHEAHCSSLMSRPSLQTSQHAAT